MTVGILVAVWFCGFAADEFSPQNRYESDLWRWLVAPAFLVQGIVLFVPGWFLRHSEGTKRPLHNLHYASPLHSVAGGRHDTGGSRRVGGDD